MSRTPRFVIFLRACVLVFVIFMLLAWLWNWATGTRFWTPLEMAVSAVLTVLFFGGFAWLVTNIGMALLYRNDPEYRAYRRSGGDPYFDSLPSPINPDSDLTRQTGLQEPEYESFVPPRHWKFQCPRCGARVEHRIDVCWRCFYGADGDSSDYLARWGNERPSDISPDEWARLSGKRDDAS
jgi:hypothetical protein